MMSFPTELNPESPTYAEDVRTRDNIFFLYKGKTVFFGADGSNLLPPPNGYIPLIWMKLPLKEFSAAVEEVPVATQSSRSTIVMKAKLAVPIPFDSIDNDQLYTVHFDVAGEVTLPVIIT